MVLLACFSILLAGRLGFWLNYATPHWHRNLLVVSMEDTALENPGDSAALPLAVVYLHFNDGSSIYVSPRRVDEAMIVPGRTRVSYAQLQIDNPVLNFFFSWSDPYYNVATEVVVLDPPSR
jgi:hypothetical protein